MTEAGNSSLRRRGAGRARNGVLLLPVSEPEAIITLEIVNDLRDELMVAPTAKADELTAGLGV